MDSMTPTDVGLMTAGGVVGTVLTKVVDYFRRKDDNRIKKDDQDHKQLIELIKLLQTVLEQERLYYNSRIQMAEDASNKATVEITELTRTSLEKDARIAILEAEVKYLKDAMTRIESSMKGQNAT